VEKSSQKRWVTSVIFIKLPKVKNNPISEKSPNLHTLPTSAIKIWRNQNLVKLKFGEIKIWRNQNLAKSKFGEF
jgi:hypothetical protein